MLARSSTAPLQHLRRSNSVAANLGRPGPGLRPARTPQPRSVAGLRKQLLEDLGQVLERRLTEDALAKLAEEHRSHSRQSQRAPRASPPGPGSEPASARRSVGFCRRGTMKPTGGASADSGEEEGAEVFEFQLPADTEPEPQPLCAHGLVVAITEPPTEPTTEPAEPLSPCKKCSAAVVHLGDQGAVDEPDGEESQPEELPVSPCESPPRLETPRLVDEPTALLKSRRASFAATCNASYGPNPNASGDLVASGAAENTDWSFSAKSSEAGATNSISSTKADRTMSAGSQLRFQRATRAVIFSKRLKEVKTFRESTCSSTTDLEPCVVATQPSSGLLAAPSDASDGNLFSEPSTQSNISKLSIDPAWTEDVQSNSWRRKRLLEMSTSSSQPMMKSVKSENFSRPSGSTQATRRRKTCLERLVLNPTNPFCMAWDVWTMVVLSCDVVQLPIAEAFQVQSEMLRMLEMVTTFTWLSDLCLSFFRGYLDGALGKVELGPRRVAVHYLKTWFALDTCVVTLDVCVIFMETSKMLGFVAIFRLFRILRLMRVLRVMKVSARLAAVLESTQMLGLSGGSEKVRAVLKICQQLGMLVVINHFIACGWYALGREMAGGWVSTLPGDEPHCLIYLYFTAFHWSITQFTPASMEVQARTTGERAFTIIAIFLGLVMFSSFVSSMTQSMTHLRQLAMKEAVSGHNVRRYIAENQVSLELSTKIIRCLRMTKATRRAKMMIGDVDAFGALPQSLLAQLQQEVFSPVLCQHEVFSNLSATDSPRFLRLCLECVCERAVVRHEDLFLMGHKGEAMYFITGGKLLYECEDEVEAVPDVEVGAGNRVAEVSLWAKWEHRGRLTALVHSETLQVFAESFQANVLASTLAVQMQIYARLFVVKSSQSCGSAHAITDLWGNDGEVEEIARRAFCKTLNRQDSLAAALTEDDAGFSLLSEVFSAWRECTAEQRRRSKCCAGFWPQRGLSFGWRALFRGGGGEAPAYFSEECV